MSLRANPRSGALVNSYAGIVSSFTQEFIWKFCDEGMINWTRLVQFNSGSDKLAGKRRSRKP
ncbi:MAG: hypothetical protein NTX53_19470 [candidate division WOR-3 bacterium]|nr:hypothetical protein [candidate division WOR-3 bacterium]